MAERYLSDQPTQTFYLGDGKAQSLPETMPLYASDGILLTTMMTDTAAYRRAVLAIERVVGVVDDKIIQELQAEFAMDDEKLQALAEWERREDLFPQVGQHEPRDG